MIQTDLKETPQNTVKKVYFWVGRGWRVFGKHESLTSPRKV